MSKKKTKKPTHKVTYSFADSFGQPGDTPETLKERFSRPIKIF